MEMNSASPFLYSRNMMRLALSALLAAGAGACAHSPGDPDKSTKPSAPGQSVDRSSPLSPSSGLVPDLLRGVWYPDDAEARAACKTYLSTDAATIERTGHDPLVGAVVVTRTMVHWYSEYGEGNFFRIDAATKTDDGAWALSGQVFMDALPDAGERGAEHAERFKLSGKGRAVSFVDAEGQSFFRCGDVRSDLYSVQ
jgi:hypothetical protein